MRTYAARESAASSRAVPPHPAPVVRQCGEPPGAGRWGRQDEQTEPGRSGRAAPGETAVPAAVDTVLRSPGDALAPPVRAYMESQFGHDFSRVRVHTDAPAAESANSVGGLAYTVGQHIAFAPGKFSPGTAAGAKLLAHELTHTIQQGTMRPEAVAQRIGERDDPSEVEADRVAATVVDPIGRSPVSPSEEASGDSRSDSRSPGVARQEVQLGTVAGAIQRNPDGAEPKSLPKRKMLTADQDLTFALSYVDDYYARVHLLLELQDKIQAAAIDNYTNFGKLVDPPSIAAAVFGEIFAQALAFVPGGKLVTAALATARFGNEMAALERDLAAAPGYYKEPSMEKIEAETEKRGERGAKVKEAGKATIEAAKAAVEKRRAAAEAVKEAEEHAELEHVRITDWREATNNALDQKQKIKEWLETHVRAGYDSGHLKDAVVKRLGPLPEISLQLQDHLERQYELELYRNKLVLVNISTHYIGTSVTVTSEELELYAGRARRLLVLGAAEGGKPSTATLRRVAELLGAPALADYPTALGRLLKVRTLRREKWERLPGVDVSRPGLGG
jgi:hypothetical protein